MIDLGSSPRILITRLSAIGDCVHTLPLIAALKARFPQSHIAWAVQPAGASLVRTHPQVDEVITVQRDWYRRWASIRETRDRLRRRRFDVAIDPQSLTKSSVLAWLSGARSRIGFTAGQARELSPWLNNVQVAPTKAHVVDRYLELLEPLGIKAPAVGFGLRVDSVASASVDSFVKRHEFSEFALINPGAGWDSKLWPHQHYAAVAQHLHTEHHLPSLVLWSGDREHAWASRIVDLAPDCACLAPPTSLPELAAFCATASLFVGSDTGPLHLAAAMGTSCVGMYGPTRVSDCGPYGKGHEPLQAYHQDGGSRERRGADNRAMRAISISSVNAACDRILSRQRLRKQGARVA